MNFILFISAMVYVCVAICVFRFMCNVNEDLKQRKHYRKHSERYGVEPTWVLAVIAVLWPLQIVGLFIYIMKGRWL